MVTRYTSLPTGLVLVPGLSYQHGFERRTRFGSVSGSSVTECERVDSLFLVTENEINTVSDQLWDSAPPAPSTDVPLLGIVTEAPRGASGAYHFV